MLQNTLPSGGGSIIAEYIYNPDGSRHYKRSHGLAGEQLHFYYAQYPFDDGAMAQEILETANNAGWTLESNEVLRRYVRLPGSIDEAFLMIDYTMNGACTNTNDQACEIYAHFNRQGSIIATTDTNGTIQDKYTYSPYGVSGESNTGLPFRFTGQRLDAETGLYYYKARYYDPEVGRFLQTDPIGYEDQQNLYAYVGNDPINGIDPTGLAECGGELANDENAELCAAATNAATDASNNLVSLSRSLGAIQYKRENGIELDSAEQSILTQFEDDIGDFDSNVDNVRQELEQGANLLRDATLFLDTGECQGRSACANTSQNTVSLSRNLIQNVVDQRDDAEWHLSYRVAHEGIHLGGATKERYGSKGAESRVNSILYLSRRYWDHHDY